MEIAYALYRVSTKNQVDKVTDDIPMQREACKDFAKRQGWVGKEFLEKGVEIIKRNRYICAHCYKNQNTKYSEFFLNKDLLESLKRDLPYLLN